MATARITPIGPDPAKRLRILTAQLAEARAEVSRIESEIYMALAEPRVSTAHPAQLLRVSEAARRLAVGETAVYAMMANGALSRIEPEGTRSVRVDSREIDALIERSRRKER